jgi:AraC-like DNA-binding protein
MLRVRLRQRDEPRLAEVFGFIEAHYHEPISLRDVLAAVNLSSDHLTTIVRRKTGRPVQEWIKERRMAQARRLLVETDLTIDQLARQVGYADSVYFVRTFRRVHGTTPSLAADRTRVARGRTHVGVETAP